MQMTVWNDVAHNFDKKSSVNLTHIESAWYNLILTIKVVRANVFMQREVYIFRK